MTQVTQTFSDSGTGGARAEACPYLFLVLEGARPLAGGARLRLDDVDEVIFGRAPRREIAFDASGGLRRAIFGVPDPRMSSRHASLSRTGVGWVLKDLGSRNGTLVDGEPLKMHVVGPSGARFQLGAAAFSVRTDVPKTADPAFVESSSLARADLGLASLLPGHDEVASLEKIAASDVPILLLGASGTGKEVVARAVHALSGRRGAFVPVNCGALPETLLESQLFGHTKGAFSGATRDEVGLVRASHEGTLFLDEIGDMPRPSQVALLRVLQEKEVTPVGETRPIAVNLRVVAATHRAVDTLEEEGFRTDLYARLAGYTHRLAPLADRLEDLGLLVSSILPKVAPAEAERLSLAPELVRAIVSHRWPLNVRELEQTLRVTSVLSEGGVLRLEHAPESVRAPKAQPASTPSPLAEDDAALRDELVAALRGHGGNVSRVAKQMGRTRMQIHRWMKRFGIDPETFR